MLKLHLTIKSILLSLALSTAFAQEATDLYLFQLHQTDDKAYHVYRPSFLSGFNPGGYTNQPWFTREGNILVSVRKKGEDQHDIYQLSPVTKKVKRITRTPSNEFSPRIHPDGKRLTVLRQVKGPQMDQQVFQVSLSGGKYTSVAPEIRNIGYYTWVRPDQLAMYHIEGENNALANLNLTDMRTRRITASVGRTLLTDPAGSIVYIHKFAADYYYLKKYNLESASIDIIAETPGLSEDFALASDGTYFMGVGSKLYSLSPGEKIWKQISDVSIYGISHITRMAISPDGTQLALVATKL